MIFSHWGGANCKVRTPEGAFARLKSGVYFQRTCLCFSRGERSGNGYPLIFAWLFAGLVIRLDL